jgi:hypoxanthine phosphoribosyltransferase
MADKDWIDMDDNGVPYSLQHFCIPRHYEQDLESILLPRGIILDR